MATAKDVQHLLDQDGILRKTVAENLIAQLLKDPQIAEVLAKQFDDLLQGSLALDGEAVPADGGISALAGIGAQAISSLGDVPIPKDVQRYDEEEKKISSERLGAVGDLYYIYQHEKIGVFRVVQKLQSLFQAGAIRLSGGDGARRLYQFDRREVLRYTAQDRLAAYRRIFGYGQAEVPSGARPNTDFHHLFTHFNNQVALFWRDKRVSDVMRARANDPSFGSIAVVRRAGLDLRNNLKWTSFGHLNVLRLEVLQCLDEAFQILGSEDVKRLFGAEDAWDVVEEVLIRYFNARLVTSPRQRLAVTGRDILRWLAQHHIHETSRALFEALLMQIAEPAEEWLTSAQSLGLAQRRPDVGVLPWDRSAPVPRRGENRPTGVGPSRSAPRERPKNGVAAEQYFESVP